MTRHPRSPDPGLFRYTAVLERGLALRTLAVFGSRGRGEELPDSDYDLVVVSDDFEGLGSLERRDRLHTLWAEAGARLPADIFGLTRAELLAMESPFIWDMLEDGRPLHDDGTWREAVTEFDRRKAAGYMIPVEGGWKIGERPPG